MVVNRLVEARKQAGLSQAKVAGVLGIPQQQYCRYENGQNEIPVRYVVVLCKLYIKWEKNIILLYLSPEMIKNKKSF